MIADLINSNILNLSHVRSVIISVHMVFFLRDLWRSIPRLVIIGVFFHSIPVVIRR